MPFSCFASCPTFKLTRLSDHRPPPPTLPPRTRRNLAAQGIVKPSTRLSALSPPPSKAGDKVTASGNSSAPAKPGASSNQGVSTRGVFDEFKTLLQWQKTNTEIDLNDLGLDPQVNITLCPLFALRANLMADLVSAG
jgi:hypothetical protein